MDKDIKRYADNGDLTSLKYIFASSLDIDPTFESYEESYNYCKAIPGLLEQHVELTPFTNNPAQWTDTYWAHLKLDLKQNFSDQRMSHMRAVAQVLLAEKIQRILKERQQRRPSEDTPPVPQKPPKEQPKEVQPSFPSEEAQAKNLQEEREKLKRENQEFEERRKKEEHERSQRRMREQEQLRGSRHRQQASRGTSSKKAIGIALAVVVVVAAAIVLLLLGRNPKI